MSDQRDKHCCDMRAKVIIGIARVLSEEECGISDSVLVDFHDFSYESPTKLPVASALTTRYCAWCGKKRDPDDERKTTEVIRQHH